MTKEELYEKLKNGFLQVLKQHQIENDTVTVSCRALTPQEAIGETARKDFPIITGKDVMIEATYRGSRGQAFTDSPTAFSGTLSAVLQMEIAHNSHNCGIFIATLNAVMNSVGLCSGTVHCKTDGPEPVSYTHLDVYKRQVHGRFKKGIVLSIQRDVRPGGPFDQFVVKND